MPVVETVRPVVRTLCLLRVVVERDTAEKAARETIVLGAMPSRVGLEKDREMPGKAVVLAVAHLRKTGSRWLSLHLDLALPVCMCFDLIS
jgi:hypothetical protein